MRYRDIEEASGVKFFHERGSLVLIASSIASRTEAMLSQCRSKGITVDRLSPHCMDNRFPYLHLPPIIGGVEGLYEEKMAGYLNPRKLVEAQLMLATQSGAVLERGLVSGIDQDDDGIHKVRYINHGEQLNLRAQTVLLAAGSFVNHNSLLQQDEKLALHCYTEPNLLYAINNEDVEWMRGMPAVIVVDPEDTGVDNMSIYLVPPIRYPDGKWYVRMGPGMQPIVDELTSLESMCDWFRLQEITVEQMHFLKGMFSMLMPSLKPQGVLTRSCIIEKTPTRYFYTGAVRDSLHVVAGGNGHGARGSDEIGRLVASQILQNEWDFPLDESRFAPILQSQIKPGASEGFLKPPFGFC